MESVTGKSTTDSGPDAQHRRLVRFMFLSLGTAVLTMALKASAAAITGSVGFLSDALESGVNVVAAILGIVALRTAALPPDSGHHFGHGKAEYLSAAAEGSMILVASALILWTSVNRLINPAPLDQTTFGLALSVGAAALNLAVGLVLIRVGRANRSLTLEADGRHLLTDVWTSVGVVVGILLVAIFDFEILDPIVALLVGVQIMGTGYKLVKRSIVGLLDASLSPEDSAKVKQVLDSCSGSGLVEFAPVRTRESGRQRFIYVTMRVPGDWSVSQGHDLADQVERAMARELPGAMTFTHVEPLAKSQ
ncbi:MAG: cation diffusion facilitator family transporter [Microthrixaceae bacterium]